MSDLCFDCLAWLGCLHCYLHLPGLSKRGCYNTCIYKLVNKYEYMYNGADSLQCMGKIRVFKLQISFENWEYAKISLCQKVSRPESAKICLRQNFSFYSKYLTHKTQIVEVGSSYQLCIPYT